jgi:hypothetical protein
MLKFTMPKLKMMTKLKIVVAALAMFMASGLFAGNVSAMPANGWSSVANVAADQRQGAVEHVRWVCGPYRCWWRRPVVWARPVYWHRPAWRRPVYWRRPWVGPYWRRPYVGWGSPYWATPVWGPRVYYSYYWAPRPWGWGGPAWWW